MLLMSSDKDYRQLVNLIEGGNVDDVVKFLDSRHLTGDNFIDHSETRKVFYIAAFVGIAADNGNVDIVDALIERGFSAEEILRYRGLEKPIHSACRAGHLCVVKSLIENHNVNVSGDEATSGRYPLRVLLAEGQQNIYPIAQYLLSKGASIKSLHPLSHPLNDCIRNDNATPEVLQLLISNGEDINSDGVDDPPLHTAVDVGRADCVEILLNAGVDVDITHGSWWPCTLPHRRHNPGTKVLMSPLMRAARINDLSMMKLLCSHGANPDYSNNFGVTTLHIAAVHDLYEIARYLIVDLVVTLDKKDIFGETPLIYAVSQRQTNTAQLILKAGYTPKPQELEFEDSDPMFENEGVRELLQEVRQQISVPRRLQDLCIFRLRDLLGKTLPCTVDNLALPDTMKNLIRLTHLEECPEFRSTSPESRSTSPESS